MASNNDFIKDISISKMQWKLKVRVIRMWEKPDRFNPSSLFSIELVLEDEKGDRIHATIGKSVLHIFKEKIKELGIYLMANFIVCQNKEKFNSTNHRLMLTFTQRTTVAETNDPDFPMNIFHLRSFKQLINKVDVNESELFDVIGEIVDFSQVQTQKQGEITRKYMDIELEDDERNKLPATFWGEFVDQVLPHLLSSNRDPIIVVMQLIKAHKFQDSYSVRNTWNTSKLWINPNFPQAEEFKKRLLSVRDSCAERLTQSISQQSLSLSDELEKGIVEVKSIAQLVQAIQEGSCWIVASIENLELEKGWCYISCKKCQKKVDKVGKIYQCPNPKCKNEDNSAIIRYKLQVRVLDNTGSVSLLLWDREAMFLIGKSAKDLKEGFIENTGGIDMYPYPVELNNVLQRKLMFKVIIKTENIQLQKEIYSVVKLTDDEQLITKYSSEPPTNELTDPDFNNNQVCRGEKEFEESAEDNELIDIATTPGKISITNVATLVEEDPSTQLSGNKIKRPIKKKKTA